MEVRPSRMLEVLVDCGALAAMMGVPVPPSARLQRTGRALDRVERSAAHRTARLVVWAMGLQAALQLPSRWKVPSDEREALMLAAREFDALPTMGRWATELRATPDDAPQADAAARALVAWLDHCDAWRRPERWQALVVAAAAWADAGTEDTRIPHPPGALASTTAHRWQTALTAVHQAAMAVDTRAAASAAIAAGARGPAIAAAVLAQRTEAVHTWLAGEGAATPGT
jgi:tRNA nucleotidyltransferase (CCA-adding enzyme)